MGKTDGWTDNAKACKCFYWFQVTVSGICFQLMHFLIRNYSFLLISGNMIKKQNPQDGVKLQLSWGAKRPRCRQRHGTQELTNKDLLNTIYFQNTRAYTASIAELVEVQ